MKQRPGTLWHEIVATTERAIAAGALIPIPTEYSYLDDGGIRFFVRTLANLSRKDEALKEQEVRARAGKKANPFLPPEKDLTVAEISDTHMAVLNKFNVMEHHLLLVTRHFEDQETLLTLQDFEALWTCMLEYDALGFYNGGREAGASQQHKHLQLVPLPLAPDGPSVPVGPLIAEQDGSGLSVPGFAFVHALERLEPAQTPATAAAQSFDRYAAMLKKLGMNTPPARGTTMQSRPYCLLVTKEWMLLVPRSREFFEDISFNSLSFAGSFFLRNDRQLERLRAVGPLNALRSVAVPVKDL